MRPCLPYKVRRFGCSGDPVVSHASQAAARRTLTVLLVRSPALGSVSSTLRRIFLTLRLLLCSTSGSSCCAESSLRRMRRGFEFLAVAAPSHNFSCASVLEPISGKDTRALLRGVRICGKLVRCVSNSLSLELTDCSLESSYFLLDFRRKSFDSS